MGQEVTAVLLGVRVKGRLLARIRDAFHSSIGDGVLDGAGVRDVGRVDFAIVGDEWTIGIALGVSAGEDDGEAVLPPSVRLGAVGKDLPGDLKRARKRWAALERAVAGKGVTLPLPGFFLAAVARA